MKIRNEIDEIEYIDLNCKFCQIFIEREFSFCQKCGMDFGFLPIKFTILE